MTDLNRQGAAGNASLATAEAGEKIITHSVNGILELLDDVNRFDLSNFRR
jgi:creatinine amidohydrolase